MKAIKRFHIYWALFVGCIVLFCNPDSGAAFDSGLQQELELLKIINEARQNPLSVAGEMGIDLGPFLKSFPEWGKLVTQGLEPVTMNGQLYRAATTNAESILMGIIPISGDSSLNSEDEFLMDTGYSAEATGIRTGALAFNNLMDPSMAMRILFEKMFRDEFDRPAGENFVILNPDFREVGIRFKSGKMELNEGTSNVFLTVCQFASPRPSAIELELVELFNQARRRPLETASLQEIDKHLERTAPIEGSRTPLRFNPLLYIAASTHAVDMLNKGYFSHTSLEGIGHRERIEAQEYMPEVEGEIIRLIASTSYINPVEAAKMHLDRLIENDIVNELSGRRSEILNSAFEDVGISFIFWEPYDTDLLELPPIYEAYYGYLIVCSLAARATSDPQATLKGVVYSDKDKNGIYGFNEGMSGVPLIVESETDLLVTFTDRAGGFDLPTPIGFYQIYSPSGLFTARQAFIDLQNNPYDLVIEGEPLTD